VNNGEEPGPVNFFISIKMGLRFKKYTQYNSSYILLKKLPVKLVVDKKTCKIENDCLSQDLQDGRMEGFSSGAGLQTCAKALLSLSLLYCEFIFNQD